MKKYTLYQYIASVTIVVLLVGLCYLISYQVVKRQYGKNLGDYQEVPDNMPPLAEGIRDGLLQSLSKQEHATAFQADGTNREAGGALTATTEAKTIQADSDYILEVYDRERDYLSKYELNPPAYLVGLDRKGLEQYVADYMEHVPLDEFQMGLLSYEIVSFSGKKVVLRKVYDQSTVPYQYYLVVERGYLVVYYADQKTVYEYTGIEAAHLPEEDQVKLAYGIFLKDQSELYGLLQVYSS